MTYRLRVSKSQNNLSSRSQVELRYLLVLENEKGEYLGSTSFVWSNDQDISRAEEHLLLLDKKSQLIKKYEEEQEAKLRKPMPLNDDKLYFEEFYVQ